MRQSSPYIYTHVYHQFMLTQNSLNSFLQPPTILLFEASTQRYIPYYIIAAATTTTTKMGRENHDPTVVHSSIALLQERFRQLQRAKEMREERELQKMLTEVPKLQFNSNSNTNTTPSTHESTRLFSHPELIMPSSRTRSTTPPHVSLSLWPTSQEDYNTSFQTPVSMNLSCPTNYTHTSQSQSLQVSSWKINGYDCDSGSDIDSGVDTSLHL